MVVFEIAGQTWPVDDRTAEGLAVAFRRNVPIDRDARDRRARGFLSDAIESALVGAASGPIHVNEDAAEALFLQLNATISNPEPIDPSYALYIEVRRYLGRLYS
jgi:hypothetical protein